MSCQTAVELLGHGIRSCAACLRRGYLMGLLAARISGLLDHPRRAVPGLLSLDDEQLVRAVGGRDAGAALRHLEEFDAAHTADRLAEARIGAICRHAQRYPAALHQLSDAPAVLFAVGDLGLLGDLEREPAVAVVGSRRGSPYGLEMSYALGRGLDAAGVIVVSGLALGIDAAAHRGCIDGAGLAIAVLAGGPDVPYPKANERLYARIKERGLILSEQPPGQRAYRWSFPARNRIMAGLAATTVVVEAQKASGSMITGSMASQLGRTVAAVPGRANARSAAGSNDLLKDGALLVTSAQDLLDDLYGAGERTLPEPAHARLEDPLDRSVLDAVEAQLGVDGICRAAGLPVREVRSVLARLEASGHLRRDALGGYHRTAVLR